MGKKGKTPQEQLDDLNVYTEKWRDILRTTIYGQSLTLAVSNKRSSLEEALKSPDTKNIKYVQGLQNAYEAMERDLMNPFAKAINEIKETMEGNDIELIESPLLAEQIAALQAEGR